MADKIPLKGLFDGSGNVTGLAEYRSADGDTLGVIHGGTGLATVATDRILTGNATSALTAEANLTFNGSTLAVTGDTTISGNLTVQGNFTETVKIATEDPIIALNTAIGSGAANTYDSGFVTERGSSTNVALIWDESEDLFNFITTTDTGVTSGNINVSGQANIKTGNITSTGNIQLTGTLQFDSGQTVNEISDDTSLTDGAATALVTENAIKTHVSAQASAFAIALG
tara:strand:- start:84 stop:767 length:684 start_codon:yes stop_codon:yes gene_type:complete